MILTANLLKKITQGKWLHQACENDFTLVGGAFDTRDIEDQEIFFAWSGEKQDGHHFLKNLNGTSIKVVIVEKNVEIFDPTISILKVQDSLFALHELARYVRSMITGQVIVVTGSSGKTSMKTWLSQVLSKRYATLVNKKSYNNHIGCPITLLSAQKQHEIIIIEVGTSGRGEIDKLTAIARPHIAILLNVGTAHIGKFGNLSNIYKAKLEIFNHLEKNGIAILPADDPKLRIQLPHQTIFFGKESQNFSWTSIQNESNSLKQKVCFQMHHQEMTVEFDLIGRHIPSTISAIIATCSQFQFEPSDLIHALEELRNFDGRMQLMQGINGTSIIDDTYNANPESVMNLIQSMHDLNFQNKILILGELSEQDEKLEYLTNQLQQDIPEFLRSVYLYGNNTDILAKIFHSILSQTKIVQTKNKAEVIDDLKPIMKKDTLIGIKGSRIARMENLLQEFI